MAAYVIDSLYACLHDWWTVGCSRMGSGIAMLRRHGWRAENHDRERCIAWIQMKTMSPDEKSVIRAHVLDAICWYAIFIPFWLNCIQLITFLVHFSLRSVLSLCHCRRRFIMKLFFCYHDYIIAWFYNQCKSRHAESRFTMFMSRACCSLYSDTMIIRADMKTCWKCVHYSRYNGNNMR